MTHKLKTLFEPGHGYTEEDWREVSDCPELTDEQMRQARPFAEVFPDLAESIRRARGRPKLDQPKAQVTLRLDAAVLDSFRKSGPGWQGRINDILRKSMGL